ncbi:tyrosine-protein phosphatase [bacterium]|nr:tyrosine-protein phosphatase [bacterium]
MKIQQINFNFNFKGRPDNYSKIDNYLSRSGQPQKADLAWLKEQGVTDIINFRTMYESAICFDEKEEAERLNINYHQIASHTAKPKEENVNKFLDLVNSIKNKGGKIHIHCYAGADRTGMYAFIYKAMNNLGNLIENEREWLAFGHNKEAFPNLINWTKDIVKKLKK